MSRCQDVKMVKMADGHVSRSSHVIALFFLGIILSAGRLSFEDGFCRTTTLNLKFGLYGQPGKALTAYLIPDQAWDTSAMILKFTG